MNISDEFVKTKINPIVGYLVNSARGAEKIGLPDSADWEYLREGTARIKALLESELNRLHGLVIEFQSKSKSYMDASLAYVKSLEAVVAKLQSSLEATEIVLEDTRRDLARAEHLSNERLKTCRGFSAQIAELQAKIETLPDALRRECGL